MLYWKSISELSLVALICLYIQTCSGRLLFFLTVQHLNPLPVFEKIPILRFYPYEPIPHKRSWKCQSLSQLPSKLGCGSSQLLKWVPVICDSWYSHPCVISSLIEQGYCRNDGTSMWFLRLVMSYCGSCLVFWLGSSLSLGKASCHTVSTRN